MPLAACDVAVGNLDEELNPAFATAPENAAAVVARFHQQYAAGEYGAIWDESRQSLKDAKPKEDWVATMENMEEVLGVYQSTEQESMREESYEGEPLITVTYITQYEQSPARELFQIIGSPDGMQMHNWKIEAPPE